MCFFHGHIFLSKFETLNFAAFSHFSCKAPRWRPVKCKYTSNRRYKSRRKLNPDLPITKRKFLIMRLLCKHSVNAKLKLISSEKILSQSAMLPRLSSRVPCASFSSVSKLPLLLPQYLASQQSFAIFLNLGQNFLKITMFVVMRGL